MVRRPAVDNQTSKAPLRLSSPRIVYGESRFGVKNAPMSHFDLSLPTDSLEEMGTTPRQRVPIPGTDPPDATRVNDGRVRPVTPVRRPDREPRQVRPPAVASG